VVPPLRPAESDACARTDQPRIEIGMGAHNLTCSRQGRRQEPQAADIAGHALMDRVLCRSDDQFRADVIGPDLCAGNCRSGRIRAYGRIALFCCDPPASGTMPVNAARIAVINGGRKTLMKGKIYVGIGGWTFEPWRSTFYPDRLPRKRELEFASRQLTSIEINGTYYSSFKPESWTRWRGETPQGFVFSVKASRFCTSRKELAGAGESVARFAAQGIAELGDRLGPVNWQFMSTKTFDPGDMEAFLKLLPREIGGLPLRHALEVRHESFRNHRFYALARAYNVAIVFADSDEYPAIDEGVGGFTYARLMRTRDDIETGYSAADLDRWAARAREWADHGDVFLYFISGAKHRAPFAAKALIERLQGV
jgi:uncharacterized protein YecE (DUF72 family)